MDFLLQTPTVHYCEMALNAIIARPWYALSNIAFLIVGSVILRQGGQHSKAFGGLALLIGTLSFVYDSTFTYLSQLFDLSGMLLLIGYLLYLNLSHVVPRQLLKQLLLVGFVVALGLIILFKGYAGNIIFGTAVLGYVGSELYLIRTKKHSRPALWLLAFGLFVVGVAFWLSDTTQLYCADIGLLNGRAIFHYTNAASIYLLFRFYTQHTSQVD